MPFEDNFKTEQAALAKRIAKYGKTEADIPSVLKNGVTLLNHQNFADHVLARNLGVAAPVTVPQTGGASQDIAGINSSVVKWQQQLKAKNQIDVNADAVARLEALAELRPLSLSEQSSLLRAKAGPQTYKNPARAPGQPPTHIDADIKRFARLSVRVPQLMAQGNPVLSMQADAERKTIGDRLKRAGVDLAQIGG